MEQATFAAGCFWGVEVTFRQISGVISTTVGYTGGARDEPTYEEVCSGMSGHAEVIQIDFDPDTISYDQLLETFWQCHDPTTQDRQGPDVGTQYRSAIFFHSAEQERAAQASKASVDAAGTFRNPIVTQITPACPFWRAEAYHQQYLEKRGQAACPSQQPGSASTPGL